MMIFPLRHRFGLVTDLFETNILNLIVVVGVVVTFVGDALNSVLDQRRRAIVSTLEDVDKKARRAQEQLESARARLSSARLRSQEIRSQAIRNAEKESLKIQQQLEADMSRLQEESDQCVQIEQKKLVQNIARQVACTALDQVERDLLVAFRSGSSARLKQSELNEFHIRETLCQLK